MSDHTLDFLLAFDGRVHHLEEGYWLKFEVRRVEPTSERPHGLSYSFTLHEPSGKRIVGFDNAHRAKSRSRLEQRSIATDHWHRTANDRGRPYRFIDAETLIGDFFDAVEAALVERGMSTRVVDASERRD